MNIDWAALFKVAGVSLLFGVGIVSVFSVGLMTLAGPEQAGAAEDGSSVAMLKSANPAARLLAAGCFAVCIAAVLYGLWLIIPQFH